MTGGEAGGQAGMQARKAHTFKLECAAAGVSALYRVCALFPQQKKVAFLSRQSAEPFDFQLLAPRLEEALPGYKFAWACGTGVRSVDAGVLLRQIWHAATARLCIVDGYVPAVSIPKRTRATCLQMWHAMGAIKKFGYQAVGTPAGRSREAARVLRMHRGYDYVIGGLKSAVPFFAEAFDMPKGRIVPLGLPRMDYLARPEYAGERKRRAEGLRRDLGFGEADLAGKTVVLYAPTFRKNAGNGNWLRESVDSLARALAEAFDALPEGQDAVLLVASHPLQGAMDGGQPATPADQLPSDAAQAAEPGLGSARARSVPIRFLAGAPTRDAFPLADYVVTDYSAVAFEAALAKLPVLFYVPDREEYRKSPGLNIDPVEGYPDASFEDAGALACAIAGDAACSEPNGQGLRGFSAMLDGIEPGCMEGIVAFACDAIGEGRRD